MPKMTENNIPKHWQIKKLGEICGIAYGKGLPVKELKPSGFPVFGANGIIGFNDKYLFEEPQVLISCRGAASGKINLSPPKCYVTNNSLVLDIKKKNELDKTYLYYALSIAKKTKLVTGTAQPQVTINNAIELDISFPTLPEQQAIVSKIEELLSDLDNGKQQLLAAQQQLKVYRQSLLKWAFEGKLTNNNVKDGELPEGWKWVKIIDIVENNKNSLKAGPFGSSLKKEFYVKDGYKIYGQEQVIIDDAFFGDYYINEKKYQELKTCQIKPSDILISLVGTVGKVLILPDNCKKGVINPRLIKISLNKEIYLHKFFKYYFESSSVKNFYSSKAQGTTMDVLNIGIIKTIPFPLPQLEEQQIIVDELESKLTVCDKIEETISQSMLQAETLRQSILKKAFEGKLI